MMFCKDSLNVGQQTPFSVIIAVMYWIGVTSKTGMNVFESTGAIVAPSIRITSLSLRNSIGISLPVSRDRSIVEVGTTA